MTRTPPSSGRTRTRTKPIKSRASIYDVAAQAGVSIKTVSRVVNNKPNISDETRARVLAVAKALSYRPNIHARGLASEHSLLIGVIFDNPCASYVSRVQLGALRECRQRGYHLVVEAFDAHSAELAAAMTALLEQSALHGVILTPPLCDHPEVLAVLKDAAIPCVLIAPTVPSASIAHVRIDEVKAGLDMTAYLIALGHRRIGFIKGDPAHGAAKARFDGYRAGLAAAGIAFAPELCVDGDFTYQSGIAAAEQLLALTPRPTAIFSSNDYMAAGVLAASQRFKLRVPEDLSIAGFDDSEIAQIVWPRLTTCRQPIAEMAAAAVSWLIEPTQALGRTLAHQLIIGASTAAPHTSKPRVTAA